MTIERPNSPVRDFVAFLVGDVDHVAKIGFFGLVPSFSPAHRRQKFLERDPTLVVELELVTPWFMAQHARGKLAQPAIVDWSISFVCHGDLA
jgi:hypothetical protein